MASFKYKTLFLLLLLSLCIHPRFLSAADYSSTSETTEVSHRAKTTSRLGKICCLSALALSSACLAFNALTSSPQDETGALSAGETPSSGVSPFCLGLAALLPNVPSAIAMAMTCFLPTAYAQGLGGGGTPTAYECVQVSSAHGSGTIAVPQNFDSITSVYDTFFPEDPCTNKLKNTDVIAHLNAKDQFQLLTWGQQGFGEAEMHLTTPAVQLRLSPRNMTLLKELFLATSLQFFANASDACGQRMVATKCDNFNTCSGCREFGSRSICAPDDAKKILGLNCQVNSTDRSKDIFCVAYGQEFAPQGQVNEVFRDNQDSTTIRVKDLRTTPKEVLSACGNRHFDIATINQLFIDKTVTSYFGLFHSGAPLFANTSLQLKKFGLNDLLSLAESIEMILSQDPPSEEVAPSLYRELHARLRKDYNARPQNKRELSECDNSCRIFPEQLASLGETPSVTATVSREGTISLSRVGTKSLSQGSASHGSESPSRTAGDSASISEPPPLLLRSRTGSAGSSSVTGGTETATDSLTGGTRTHSFARSPSNSHTHRSWSNTTVVTGCPQDPKGGNGGYPNSRVDSSSPGIRPNDIFCGMGEKGKVALCFDGLAYFLSAAGKNSPLCLILDKNLYSIEKCAGGPDIGILWICE